MKKKKMFYALFQTISGFDNNFVVWFSQGFTKQAFNKKFEKKTLDE